MINVADILQTPASRSTPQEMLSLWWRRASLLTPAIGFSVY